MKKTYVMPITELITTDSESIMVGSLTVTGDAGTATPHTETLDTSDPVLSRDFDGWFDADEEW